MVCALLGLLVTAVAVPGAQADDLKKKRHQVHKSVRHAAAELDETSAALTRAMDRVKAAKGQLRDARSRYATTQAQLRAAVAEDRRIQRKLEHARAELAKARVQLAKGKAAVVDQRTDIGLLAAANFQSGDPRLMQLVVILKSQKPSDMVTQMSAVDNAMGREEIVLTGLKERRAELAARESRVEVAKERVAAQKEASRVVVERKQALSRQARSERDKVTRFFQDRVAASRDARRIMKADLSRLRALKAQEAAILRKIKEQAAHQAGFNGHTGGFLDRPVPGYVTSPYGWRRHPIYGYWGLHDGTDFHAPCGTPLHAAAGGVVAAEYYSSVWGNRLFVNVGRVNGRAMTLIYNHISSYRVGVGSRVGRGEVLAYAGTTGWSTACHLHFTVMLDGNPVDPMSFM